MNNILNQPLFAITILTAFCLSPLAQSQYDDSLVEDTAESFSSEEIDIDGNFNRPTPGDRLRKAREKLEKENQEAVDKKIEQIRLKEERKLGKKLKKAFNSGNLNNLNEEEQTQPPPSSPPPPPHPVANQKEVQKEVQKEGNEEYQGAVIPYMGISFFQGSEFDYESSTSVGVSLETFISKKIKLSFGFHSLAMDIQDRCGPQAIFPYPTNYSTYIDNSFCNTYYFRHFPQSGRVVKFSQINFDMSVKFFLKNTGPIRPYIGPGLGYSRIRASYDQQSPNPYNNLYYFRDEEYSSGGLLGLGFVGTNIIFHSNIGANFEFRYSKSFKSIGGESGKNIRSYPDQQRLESIAEDIQESNLIALNAGLFIRF